jgi:hypothetical protein
LQIEGFLAELDFRPVRQSGRIGQYPVLMRRILVEDIDGLAQHLIGRYRQEALDRAQGIDAGFVDVVDFEVDRLAGHDVDRHVVDHLYQPRRVGIGLDLLGDDAPRHHQRDVVTALVANGSNQQVERLGTDLDQRVVRQVFRIRQELVLVGGVLVEHVDARADEVF